jgi:hypothetical protein
LAEQRATAGFEALRPHLAELLSLLVEMVVATVAPSLRQVDSNADRVRQVLRDLLSLPAVQQWLRSPPSSADQSVADAHAALDRLAHFALLWMSERPFVSPYDLRRFREEHSLVARGERLPAARWSDHFPEPMADPRVENVEQGPPEHVFQAARVLQLLLGLDDRKNDHDAAAAADRRQHHFAQLIWSHAMRTLTRATSVDATVVTLVTDLEVRAAIVAAETVASLSSSPSSSSSTPSSAAAPPFFTPARREELVDHLCTLLSSPRAAHMPLSVHCAVQTLVQLIKQCLAPAAASASASDTCTASTSCLSRIQRMLLHVLLSKTTGSSLNDDAIVRVQKEVLRHPYFVEEHASRRFQRRGRRQQQWQQECVCRIAVTGRGHSFPLLFLVVRSCSLRTVATTVPLAALGPHIRVVPIGRGVLRYHVVPDVRCFVKCT